MVDLVSDRRTQQRGAETRTELLLAALREFSSVGFEAASTRTIAARAGVRQGQLTYHFPSKDELWRATVDYLFQRFDAELTEALASSPAARGEDPVVEFEATVRALVQTVSRLPELNRVMVHEATEASERLTWIVDVHVRRRFDQLATLWSQVKQRGGTHLDADPIVLYYCLIGAASLLYVNAPEAHQLLGVEDTSAAIADRVDAHADTLVAMFLGPQPNRGVMK
jgi:TetR/AcrR family transcriptional regulator